MKKTTLILLMATLAISLAANISIAGERSYVVSVTNITVSQTFTPIMAAVHKKGVTLFTPGSPASEELATLAEGGDTAPLSELLLLNPDVGHVETTGGLLGPGETVDIEITGYSSHKYLSLAAMMLPTNDGFIALNGVAVPRGNKVVMYTIPGYDAGSEINDESCDNIPGPFGCDGTGTGFSDDEGEGFVHIHSGIHGIADLFAADYDWKNPVARVVIKSAKE